MRDEDVTIAVFNHHDKIVKDLEATLVFTQGLYVEKG